MSIKALNWAFDLYFENPSHKLVMLALADNATNEGLAYPFVKTIAMKSCLEIRQTQYILRELERKGYITTEEHFKKGNKRTSNCYQLHMHKSFKTISKLSTGVHSSAGEGCTPVQGRGAVECTHALSKTVINSNEFNELQDRENQQPKHITLTNNLKQQQVVLPDWLDKKIWNEFKEHRKQLKKPMTTLAEQKMIKKLSDLKNIGQNTTEILEESIINGWCGVFELKKNKQNLNNNVNNVKIINNELRSTVPNAEEIDRFKWMQSEMEKMKNEKPQGSGTNKLLEEAIKHRGHKTSDKSLYPSMRKAVEYLPQR